MGHGEHPNRIMVTTMVCVNKPVGNIDILIYLFTFLHLAPNKAPPVELSVMFAATTQPRMLHAAGYSLIFSALGSGSPPLAEILRLINFDLLWIENLKDSNRGDRDPLTRLQIKMSNLIPVCTDYNYGGWFWLCNVVYRFLVSYWKLRSIFYSMKY